MPAEFFWPDWRAAHRVAAARGRARGVRSGRRLHAFEEAHAIASAMEMLSRLSDF